MRRAALYTRVSTRAQEDGYSLAAQEKDEREWCRKNDYDVVEVFSDTFTGHDSLEERDGMQAALRMIREHRADILVIWKVDRAGRFVENNLEMWGDVKEAGGQLAVSTDGLVPNTPTGKLVFLVQSWSAENEWETIRQRAEMGRNGRVESGKILVTSSPLYGYLFSDSHKSTYHLDTEAAPVIQDIFNKADGGWSTRQIASWLNDQHTPTSSKLLFQRGQLSPNRKVIELWSNLRVADILRERSYTGEHATRRYQTTRTKVQQPDGKYKTRVKRLLRAEDDGVRVARTIPQIVSVEQFNRVQAQVKNRYHDWTNEVPEETLLNKGLSICGVCGAPMVRFRHSGSNEHYWSYTCSRRSGLPDTRGLTCPGICYIVKAEKVDREVWEAVSDILKDGEKYNRLVKSRTAILADRHQEATRKAGNVDKELAELRATASRLFERMNHETDETIYAMQHAELQRLNQTIQKLEKRAIEAQAYVNTTQTIQDAHTSMLKSLERSLAAFRAGTHPRQDRVKQEVFDILIEEARYSEAQKLTREEKRVILRSLGIKVKMFPTNSDFFRINGRRWDFEFADPGIPSIATA